MAYVKKNLGDTWDKNTDYQAIINDAVKNGDYQTAAQAEKLRNDKINATGSNYATTNKYAGYLDTTDYSVLGKNQMASGASWQDVLDTYNKRYNKSANTVGLEQYANDEVQQAMWQYVQNNMQQTNQNTNGAQTWVDNYTQENPTPTYESKYDPKIDEILNEILNREDFSYNAENDPLYQQYAEMYQREGDRAAKNTLADAAASAGGMNSYAITAANQAASNYNAQLNDKIPELYQLAYDMYLRDKESKVEDLGILQQMDDSQYGRYRDTMADYKDDRNFAYGAYQDDVSQGNWQTNFDYNKLVNDRNYNTDEAWKNKEWNAAQDETALNNSRYDQETAKEEVWNLISLGVTPSADLIARAGMNQSDVNLAVAAVKAQNTKTSGGSSGGSGGGSYEDKGDDNQKYSTTDTNPVGDDGVRDLDDGVVGSSDVIGLGVGPINQETLLKLVENGAVILHDDMTVEWALGWGPSNWKEALTTSPKDRIDNLFPTLNYLK